MRPDLVVRGLARQRERLEATWRLALSLDPRRPLSRGFALVTAGERVLTGAAEARAAGRMTLTFHDGTVAVSAGDGVEPEGENGLSSGTTKQKRAPRPARPASIPQDDLFAVRNEKD